MKHTYRRKYGIIHSHSHTESYWVILSHTHLASRFFIPCNKGLPATPSIIYNTFLAHTQGMTARNKPVFGRDSWTLDEPKSGVNHAWNQEQSQIHGKDMYKDRARKRLTKRNCPPDISNCDRNLGWVCDPKGWINCDLQPRTEVLWIESPGKP